MTELITGIDLVQEQLRIASGLPLQYSQEDVKCTGHAIECRINAEDPITLLPRTGVISTYEVPGGPGVRIDSHCYQGYSVPPFWDSLLSKLIAWAPTRDEAIARMSRALHEYRIDGVATTIPFQLRLLKSREFRSGEMFTDSVEELMKVDN